MGLTELQLSCGFSHVHFIHPMVDVVIEVVSSFSSMQFLQKQTDMAWGKDAYAYV
jgi:hypothetical protein